MIDAGVFTSKYLCLHHEFDIFPPKSLILMNRGGGGTRSKLVTSSVFTES